MALPATTGIQVIAPGDEPTSAEYSALSQAFCSQADRSISIVFVHGLQGDSVRTWTSTAQHAATSSRLRALFSLRRYRSGKASTIARSGPSGLPDDESPKTTGDRANVFWPRDLLAADVRDARLLTFGYSSDVLSAFRATSQNNVMQHAQNLLGDLGREGGVSRTKSLVSDDYISKSGRTHQPPSSSYVTALVALL